MHITKILSVGCTLFVAQSFLAQLCGFQTDEPAELLTQDGDEQLTVTWTVDLDAPCYGSAAAGDIDGDGKWEIVFGTYFNDEHAYALNGEDGSILWRYASDGGPMDASVIILPMENNDGRDSLVADSAYGWIYSIDGAGKLNWREQLPSGTDSPSAIADLDGDGELDLVVGTMVAYRSGDDRNGRVVAFNLSNREQIWEASIPGHVQSEPALAHLNDDEVLDVLVTTWMGDHQIRALNGVDGSLLWSHAMRGNMYHGPSVFRQDDELLVAVSSTESDLCLLDVAGNEKWTRDIGGYCFAPTTIADVNADGKAEIIACGEDVVAFSLDGDELWRFSPSGSIARGVTPAQLDDAPDVELVFAAGTKLYILNGSNGSSYSQIDLTIQGDVYESLDNAPLVGDFDDDGHIDIFIVGGRGLSDDSKPRNYGRAFLIKTSSTNVAADNEWLTFRGNSKRTGTHPDRSEFETSTR